MPITNLRLTGTPYERGIQHGRAVRTMVSTHVEPFIDRLLKTSNAKTDQIDDFTSRYEQLLTGTFGDLIEETRGLAEGMQVTMQRALLFQLIWEFLNGYLPFRVGHATLENVSATECSSFVACGDSTVEGSPIATQNTDYPDLSLAEVLPIVTDVSPSDGYKYVGRANIGYLGTPRVIGFNEKGLAFVGSGVHQIRDADFGVPPLTIAKHGLESCSDVDEVLSLVRGINHWGHGGENLDVVDAKGNMARIEFTSKRAVMTISDNGFLASTNHYLSKELSNRSPSPNDYPSSFLRYNRLVARITEQAGQIDLSSAKDIMSDHQFPIETPESESCVCRHGRLRTIANVTAKPSSNILTVTVGNPCSGQLLQYTLHS